MGANPPRKPPGQALTAPALRLILFPKLVTVGRSGGRLFKFLGVGVALTLSLVGVLTVPGMLGWDPDSDTLNSTSSFNGNIISD